MRIAVIPARSGSKRIPSKNTKFLSGQPIIGLTIDATLRSGVFDKIFVSTDSQEIAAIARSYGAETPFLRPSALSDDYATTVDVMKHAVEHIADQEHPAIYCCIYPTAPFISKEHLEASHQILVETEADYVFPVSEYIHPIQRALFLNDAGEVTMAYHTNELARTQDLRKSYYDVGQFYWGSSEAWLYRKGIFTSKSLGLVVPAHAYRDINTFSDWDYAEEFYEFLQWKKQMKSPSP